VNVWPGRISRKCQKTGLCGGRPPRADWAEVPSLRLVLIPGWPRRSVGSGQLGSPNRWHPDQGRLAGAGRVAERRRLSATSPLSYPGVVVLNPCTRGKNVIMFVTPPLVRGSPAISVVTARVRFRGTFPWRATLRAARCGSDGDWGDRRCPAPRRIPTFAASGVPPTTNPRSEGLWRRTDGRTDVPSGGGYLRLIPLLLQAAPRPGARALGSGRRRARVVPEAVSGQNLGPTAAGRILPAMMSLHERGLP
jgi:hypothetical protein